MSVNKPILFLIFNRPSTTKKVFNSIKQTKPPRLYIAADGPREHIQNEDEKCAQTRSIIDMIDWKCEVLTRFRKKNLGCKAAVSDAISWFFDTEEMGIILEDDCLPSQAFYMYCEELLEKYRYDDRIFLISGYNKQNTWNIEKYDYFFSHLGGIWGWATWKRAWKHYDADMLDLEEFSSGGYFEFQLGRKAGKMRKSILMKAKRNNLNSWAYPWGFTRHKYGGLACVPSKSLIKNIGFGINATHTKNSNTDPIVDKHEISFPLRENKFIIADKNYDIKFLKPNSVFKKILSRLKILM